MIKIIIADDHEIVVEGLISLICPEDGIQIVGEANNGNDVIPLLQNHSVDVAVLDISMPGIDGIELTKRICENHPNVKILILSMYADIGHIRKAIEAGVHGYILKNKGKEELVSAIQALYEGEEYFGKEVTQQLVLGHRNKNIQGEIKLTRREKEVLQLIAQGKTTPQISKTLFVADSTIETHRRNLIDKTGVKNSKELIRFAIENGYD